MRPALVGTVRMWPVSRAVNSVGNNGADLLVPMNDPGAECAAEAAVNVNPA